MEDEAKKPTGSKKAVVVTIVVTAIVMLLAVGAVWFWQNRIVRDKDAAIDQLEEEVADLQEDLDEAQEGLNDTQTNETAEEEQGDKPDEEVSNETDEEVAAPETVVVYQPGGLFTKAMKTELEKKLINPLVDYEETSSEIDHQVLTMTIEIREGTPEYLVEVIYDDGGSLGMLYGEHAKATQPWYVPGCKGGCPFTDEYKAKYPEVVE